MEFGRKALVKAEKPGGAKAATFDFLGTALLHGRIEVANIGSADWADYMHYGDFNFRLKTRRPQNRPQGEPR
jgi:hypothetical protein